MTTPQAQPRRVTLSGSQTIREAAGTQAVLQQALSTAEDVVVDCTDVAAIDLSCLQVLAAAGGSARSAGRVLTIAAPPGGLLDAALARAGFLCGAGATAGDPTSWGSNGDDGL